MYYPTCRVHHFSREKPRPSWGEWICSSCSTLLDRDINATRNIKAAGLAVLACGENVRLVSPNGISSSQ